MRIRNLNRPVTIFSYISREVHAKLCHRLQCSVSECLQLQLNMWVYEDWLTFGYLEDLQFMTRWIYFIFQPLNELKTGTQAYHDRPLLIKDCWENSAVQTLAFYCYWHFSSIVQHLQKSFLGYVNCFYMMLKSHKQHEKYTFYCNCILSLQ